MGERLVLLTAPCGCVAYEAHDGGVTWGVDRCPQHPGEALAPEIADYLWRGKGDE
ncbi:MAG: hypothetical protein ABFD94_06820 [Armatimonadia bacterium]